MPRLSTRSSKPSADVPVPPTASTSIVDGGSAAELPAVNLDDDEIYSGRGNSARRGGTTNARGGDSGKLGAPAEQLSRSNGPREKNL